MSGKWLYFDIYLSSLLVILTHNIYCNRWQCHVHLYVQVKDFTLFIDSIIFLLYLLFLYSHFLFLQIWLLLSSSFIQFNYGSVDLLGKKGILLIDTFQIYSRMLQVDDVCKHSYIFSNSSVQSGYESFIITRKVNSCYGPYSLLLIFCMLVE